MFGAVHDLFSFDSRAFVKSHGLGAGAGSALDVYRRFYREGRLDGAFCSPFPITRREADGETVKFSLDVGNGIETESVIIPRPSVRGHNGPKRATLCVSSQIGCAMGCRFCETAQMGLVRNLSAAEIVAQWFAAAHSETLRSPARISNIVFMGMGEPMDNLDAVLSAIRILADHNGPAMAPANISVSTVGRIEGIRRYAMFARQEGFKRVKLAVSINAPNDDIRASIMPINRAAPMADLMETMLEWTVGGGCPILIEYVVIPTVNDDVSHADELAEYLQPLRCKVNLIPYNPRRDSPWVAPDEGIVHRFRDRLVLRGVFVTRRTTYGRSAMAACGQLGNPSIRSRRFVPLGC